MCYYEGAGASGSLVMPSPHCRWALPPVILRRAALVRHRASAGHYCAPAAALEEPPVSLSYLLWRRWGRGGGGILAASGTAYSLPPPAAEAGRGLHFNELAMKMKHTFLGYQCHGQGMSIHSV